MTTAKTYFIKRGDFFVWLSQNEEPLSTDTIIEERTLAIADEGKIFVDENNEVIGACFWNKHNQIFTEVDIPEEPEEEIEEDGEEV